LLRHSDRLERTATPLRLFCRPFEDLLDAVPRKQKQKGCIARAHVAPIWLWVTQTLLPAESAAYIANIKQSVLTHSADRTEAYLAAFWPKVCEAIRAVLADPAGRRAAHLALNGAAALGDAEEIALLLHAHAEIAEIQKKMPRLVPTLDENLLWSLRENYDRLVQSDADAAPYVAVIAMNRLARPWEALRLPLSISRRSGDTLISKTDMGLVGEILFARMDGLRDAVMAVRHPQFDVEALLENVAGFAELSSAIVKEIEVRRDGEWGQRLLKERAAVGEVMDGLMERAPNEIAAGLPLQKGGGAKGADFVRPVDPQKAERAQRYARLIMGSRAFAAAASFAARQKEAYDAACAHLTLYNEDVVREMRSAQGERLALVQQQFALSVTLSAILFGEREADLLRRRGRAAMGTVA
jgi:hypothetical protein